MMTMQKQISEEPQTLDMEISASRAGLLMGRQKHNRVWLRSDLGIISFSWMLLHHVD